MQLNPEAVIDAALQLAEDDRVRLIERLLEITPDEPPGLSVDDPAFEAELERRFADRAGAIPSDEVWQVIDGRH